MGDHTLGFARAPLKGRVIFDILLPIRLEIVIREKNMSYYFLLPVFFKL